MEIEPFFMEESRNSINNIDELLKKVFTLMGNKYNDVEINKDNEYFFYLLIQKLSDNLFTSNFLMKEMKEYPQMFGGLCLILRTCLSDVIIFNYLYSFYENEKTDDEQGVLQERINEIWGDHLAFIIQFNQRKSSWNKLNGVNKENERLLINERFKDYFKVPIDKSWNYTPRVRKNFSIDNIMNEKLAKDMVVFKAYELYHIYSKIEHIGEVTDDVHNWIYNAEDNALKSVLESFSIIAKTICKIGQHLFKDFEGANIELEQFSKKF